MLLPPSNDLDYLKAVCPTYRGEAFYQAQSAVCDGNLITASGVALQTLVVETSGAKPTYLGPPEIFYQAVPQ